MPNSFSSALMVASSAFARSLFSSIAAERIYRRLSLRAGMALAGLMSAGAMQEFSSKKLRDLEIIDAIPIDLSEDEKKDEGRND